MDLKLGEDYVNYPVGGMQLTLGLWLTFQEQHGRRLDEYHEELLASPDNLMKQIDIAEFVVERAYCLAASFTGYDLQVAKNRFPLQQVMNLYENSIMPIFAQEHIPALQYVFHHDAAGDPLAWALPPAVLDPYSPMTFGEFIDAKQVADLARKQHIGRWEMIHHLAAIFLRHPDEPYSDELLREGGDRLTIMLQLPMDYVMQLAAWWEQLNEFISDSFTLFGRPKVKPGEAMKKHFDTWGWVNFLKSIASTKIYDIPNLGLNSIDCARRARLVEVLTDASESKDYSEAEYIDTEARTKK